MYRIFALFLAACLTSCSTVSSFGFDAAGIEATRIQSSALASRRNFLTYVTTAAAFLPGVAVAKDDDVTAIVADLKRSRELLEPLSAKLEAKEWDSVRSVLKGPGLGELWNLGASKNPIGKFARATGDIDLLELSEELAISLQTSDQLTYGNAFVYTQPGNGKVDIKGPQTMVAKAIGEIDNIIKIASQ
eukprot:CAMPEP_0194267536 /NCGR_PEP_ID=MMETSP0169-20130528/2020_1 /TAXON_ID=218684 /ORGANISM="Corethron pennatum, Strain L29A3" /LENGTH=188 /DNA_ID=CAMNT_0039008405 /DNA_START=138 /DNA_END=704 /DNA_ORIENTATION=-